MTRVCTISRVARGDGARENPSDRHGATSAVVLLDGDANHPPEILGNKGHGIDAMRRHKLPVPPAFCITTEIGMRYLAEPTSTIDAIWNDVLDRMSRLEAETSRTSGGARVRCRSACAQEPPSQCPA
jgi:pyruvate,orthophosphate dikinase